MAKKDDVLTIELFKQASSNKIELGVRVTEIKQSEGNQKKDRDGNLMYDEAGSPLRWDDSFYVTFTFQGGEISQKVNKETYNVLLADNDLMNSAYLMLGHVAVRTVENRSFAVVVADSFQKLF